MRKTWLVRVSILTWTDPKPSIRYKVAQSVAFEDLALTVDTPQRFLAAPDRAHAIVMASIRHLSIEGANFDEHDVEIMLDITNGLNLFLFI